MDFKYLSNFIELGALAVVCLGLLGVLVYLVNCFRKDVKEGRKETNEVLNRLTIVIDTINRSSGR